MIKVVLKRNIFEAIFLLEQQKPYMAKIKSLDQMLNTLHYTSLIKILGCLRLTHDFVTLIYSAPPVWKGHHSVTRTGMGITAWYMREQNQRG